MEMEKDGKCIEDVPLKEIIHHSKICALDVKEWTMELRENNIIMDEKNVKAKEKKIRDIEENEARQRQVREKEIEERHREIDKQRNKLGEERIQMNERLTKLMEIDEIQEVIHLQHQDILSLNQQLVERELEVHEKNSLLEITLNMKQKDEKIALQKKNLQAIELIEEENQLNLARESEIEVREKEIALQQQNLDAREVQIEEENRILEIAIHLNDFR